MAAKNYKSVCGKSITKAHYYRNLAREAMDKTLGMSSTEKASRLFVAYRALEKALLATPEGRDLLMKKSKPEWVDTKIAALPDNQKARAADKARRKHKAKVAVQADAVVIAVPDTIPDFVLESVGKL